MKTFFLFLALLVPASQCRSYASSVNGLYLKTFGDKAKPAIVFIHGGPGYNSWDFELTTAPALSQLGFYVIVYDQRGQGRSAPVDPSLYNYKQYADDLKAIIDQLHLEHPVLLAHSHGGPIAIEFERHYPDVAKKIILISAPIRFDATMHAITNNCYQRFSALGQTKELTEMASLDYELFSEHPVTPDQEAFFTAATFHEAQQCGLYDVQHPTPAAEALRTLLNANPIPHNAPLSGETQAMPAFIKNENYIHADRSDFIAAHRNRFCGIYGDEDGLFTPLELNVIQRLLNNSNEPNRFALIPDASHILYIDQQTAFFDALETTCQIKPQ